MYTPCSQCSLTNHKLGGRNGRECVLSGGGGEGVPGYIRNGFTGGIPRYTFYRRLRFSNNYAGHWWAVGACGWLTDAKKLYVELIYLNSLNCIRHIDFENSRSKSNCRSSSLNRRLLLINYYVDAASEKFAKRNSYHTFFFTEICNFVKIVLKIKRDSILM